VLSLNLRYCDVSELEGVHSFGIIGCDRTRPGSRVPHLAVVEVIAQEEGAQKSGHLCFRFQV
jgi:hypothetical protein